MGVEQWDSAPPVVKRTVSAAFSWSVEYVNEGEEKYIFRHFPSYWTFIACFGLTCPLLYA